MLMPVASLSLLPLNSPKDAVTSLRTTITKLQEYREASETYDPNLDLECEHYFEYVSYLSPTSCPY